MSPRQWPSRAWSSGVRTAIAIIITTGSAFLVTACAGSTSPSGAGTSPNAHGTGSSLSGSVMPALAFARCVRSHGDQSFPDPNSSGMEPPSAKQEAATNPRFPAAARACAHLLPNGGQETHAQILVDQHNAVKFAECMRTHGVRNWPSPGTDPEGRPVFNLQAVGIDQNSPQVQASEQRCQSLLHLTQLPAGA